MVKVKGLSVVLLIILVCRIAAIAVNEHPVYESRREAIALRVAEEGTLKYCNAYFPFCGPENETTASVAPLPILIFAAAIDLFGYDEGYAIAVAVFHLLLALIGAYLVYRISLTLFEDRRSALIGALLWGLYPPMMFKYDLALEAEPLMAFLLCAGLLALLRGLVAERAGLWILAGVCFGLAAQTRTSFLYFPLALALLVPCLPGSKATRRLAHYALLLSAFALVLIPWTVRNFVAFDAFVPGSTLNGYNLYRQNQLLEKGYPVHYVSHPEAQHAQTRLIVNRKDLTRNENEHEMDKVYREAAFRIIKENPGRYLLLSLWRFLPLTTNHGVHALTVPWKLAGVWNLILIGAAAVTVLFRRFRPALMLPVVAIVGYNVIGHMLVAGKMRLFMPTVPFVIILASGIFSLRAASGNAITER